ncbi:ATP-binding protein [Nocardia panacis]|nr:tetratricopeptide repeat protein [Nocardia panacis]
MTAGEGSGTGRDPSGTRSDLSGSAADVVQARDVAGGIHFHSTGREGASGESAPVPAQLPADVRGFVNRIADIEHMDRVLEQEEGSPGPAGVCVVTGTAGVGKTSLAVHWGHRVRHEFPDGQLYVNLRGYDPGEPVSAGQALERFLIALGVAPAALPTDLETRSALFRTLLAQRRLLIVLDNAATVKQVRPLLPGAGRCLVLVTSRSRLSGLVARDGAHRLDLELFDEPAAIELLYGTVAGYRSGDSEHEIVELAQLCARLPLALRIAAERAAVRPYMPMGELIENLRDESHLWSALSVEDDDEADAVRTVFAWSYRALPPQVARMFRLLGLHPGPEFSLHAAAALAAVPVREVSQLLDALVGAHLLEQIGRDRYQFHDLLRAYSTDQGRHCDSAEDRDAALERVLAWYVHTLDKCLNELPIPILEPVQDIELDSLPAGVQPLVFADPDSAAVWFDVERTNFVACVRLAVKTSNDRVAWQIPILLRGPFPPINAVDDWFATTELGLVAARRLGETAAEAILLDSMTMAYRQAHHLDKAEETGRKALEMFRRIGHPQGEALSLNQLALVNSAARRLTLAHSYLNEAEVLAERHNYTYILICVATNRPVIYRAAGRYQEAYDDAISALDLIRRSGSRIDEVDLSIEIMRAAHGLGRYDEAAYWAEATLPMSPTKLYDGVILLQYGNIQRDRGDPELALATYHRAAVILQQLGSHHREAETLDATGSAYAMLGRLEEAAHFYVEAANLYRRIVSNWGIAVALHHLAQASFDLGRSDSAKRYWNESLASLSEFDDPAAETLRESIDRSLRQLSTSNRESDRSDGI